MENNYGFCPRCGAELPQGAEYCPECGASFVEKRQDDIRRLTITNPMTFFIVLLAAYTVMSIVEGVYVTAFNDMFVSNFELIYGSGIDEYLSNMGLASIDEFADLMFKEGIVSIVGGAITAMALILCIKRRFWKIAFWLCIIASFELLISMAFMPSKMISSELLTMLLQTGVGLLVARGIYVNRRMFR